MGYCASNGHCNVPQEYKSDPALGKWVQSQRAAIKNGTLQRDRETRLTAIGFQAGRTIETWNEKFTKLEAYCASNGHCNVPQRYKTDPALGTWVDNQRTAIKNGTLQPDQVLRLSAIRFQA